MNKALCVLTLLTLGAQASLLEVYKDKARYTYKPVTNFIGLAQVTKAVCEQHNVMTVRIRKCEADTALCNRYNELHTLRERSLRLNKQLETLDAFRASLKLTLVDAKNWLKTSEKLAKEESRLIRDMQEVTFRADESARLLEKQTSAKFPVAFAVPCNGEATLTLPKKAITFAPLYEADITDNNITLTQKLQVTNRSGIDIKADEGRFYFYRATSYITPPHFIPQIVSDTPIHAPSPLPRIARAKTIHAVETAPAPDKPIFKHEENRLYTVAPLKLPSDGTPKHFILGSYTLKTSCGIEWHAYERNSALYVCRFTPKEEIESKNWKVTKNGKVLNEKASGRYEGKRYALYVEYVKSLNVTRKPYVPNKKEDGFFETKVKKRGGNVLSMTNLSNKTVRLHVIERIPVSTTEKIKVKPIKPTNVKNFKVDKEGKATFSLTLKPAESKTVEVLYEIIHDKAVKSYLQ
jgi:hypothetical protein